MLELTLPALEESDKVDVDMLVRPRSSPITVFQFPLTGSASMARLGTGDSARYITSKGAWIAVETSNRVKGWVYGPDTVISSTKDPGLSFGVSESSWSCLLYTSNASSVHRYGREARMAVDSAREKVASLIGANPREIIFTSGGTEADNLAIKGIARSMQSKGNHLVTTRIEHHAVLHTFESLEKEGFKVTYVPCDKNGLIDPEDIRRAVTKNTILISVIHGQNEVGTIEPIEEIGSIAREHNILFHSDAVQSAGKIPIDVNLSLIHI